MRSKKLLLGLITALMLSATACGGAEEEITTNKEGATTTVQEDGTTKADDADKEENTTEETTTEAPVLEDISLAIDGVTIEIGGKVNPLLDGGWKFDESKYEKGHTVKGRMKLEEVKLVKDGCKAPVLVSFINPTVDEKDILETKVSNIIVARMNYATVYSTYPEILLQGKLKFGDDEETVKATLGEPESRAENGDCIEYEYAFRDYKMVLRIYKGEVAGLGYVEISKIIEFE